uniref:Uncharacterized protein n=1 Tax=Amphimedon queenslandica TaxID=400682 RepID=A0A1X7VUZ4_AMPQE
MSASFRLNSRPPPPPLGTRYSLSSYWSSEYEKEKVCGDRILSVWMKAHNFRTYSRQMQRGPVKTEGGADSILTLRSVGRNLRLLKNSNSEDDYRDSMTRSSLKPRDHFDNNHITATGMKFPKLDRAKTATPAATQRLSSRLSGRYRHFSWPHDDIIGGDVTPPPSPPPLDSLMTLTRLKFQK